MFRSALSSSLATIDGFNVMQKFSDGKKLVDYFQDGGKADLIILDLEMPVLDGLSALVEIRKIDKDVKIIMFSSATVKGAEKTFKALSEGANDFVPKMEGSCGGASRKFGSNNKRTRS
jgi:two-component system chemotaxis response regulator CheB